MSESVATVITAADAARLIELLDGPVLLPEEDGYEAETRTWNLSKEHRPAIVIGAMSACDVQTAVRFAAARRLPVAVVATGHGAVVSADGAVMITTHRMDEVIVDPAAGTVRIGAGARWQQVVDAAAKVGLALPAGSSATVGAVAYTLGGGLSPVLSRKYGFAADLVRSIQVVTPDGLLRTVDEGHEPELFWALRGGKGNFGVVTAVESEAVLMPQLFGGALFYAGENLREVIEAFRAATVDAPDELTLSLAMLRLPDAPFVPEPLRGRFVVTVRVAYLGTTAEAEPLIAGLRTAAPTLLDTVGDMPFTAVASIHSDPVDPLPVVERTALLAELPDEAVETLIRISGPDTDFPATVIEMRHLGGALTRRPVRPSAVLRPDAAYSLFIASIAPPDLHDQLHQAQDVLIEALAPHAADGALLNFLSAGDTDPERVRIAFDSETYSRLARVKAHYDPINLFRLNHNIPPASDR